MSDSKKILQEFKDGKIDISEVQTKLAELEIGKITYKVSIKGAISFYGIRRMPITLYAEELAKIVDIANGDDFAEFLNENKAKLSKK